MAIDLFAARGLGEVTVDEIADTAGISPRTFFRYFPTKGHVVRAHQRRLVDRLVRALAARPPDEGPVTALRAALLATSSMRADDRERIVVVGRLLADAGEGAALDIDAGRNDELVAMLAQRARLDPTRDLRPAVVVAAMTGAAQATFRAWVDSGGTGGLEEMVADTLELLDHGLPTLDRTGTRRPPGRRRDG